MDSSVIQRRTALALGGLLTLAIGSANLQAANLLKITQNGTVVTTLAFACNTQTGAVPQTIQVVGLAAPGAGHVYNVTISTPLGHGILMTASPATAQITTANTPLTYTFSDAVGCVGQTTSTGLSLVFSSQLDSGSVTADASLTSVTNTVTTSTTSGLVASGVTVLCSTGGTPGPAQPVYVTSLAAGGIPFTVTANASLAFVGSGGTATTVTPVTFTVAAASGCNPGSLAVGKTISQTVHLASTFGAPVGDLLVPVTVLIVGSSTLTVTPVPAAPSVSVSYTKGSGIPGVANVSVGISGGSNVLYTVNTASLPVWLTVNTTSGTTTGALAFSTTSAADTLAPGSYSATVYLKSSGQMDLAVPVTMLLTNKTPKLLVNPSSATPNQISMNWTLGSAVPTVTITAASSDTPISYTVTTGGVLLPTASTAITNLSGLAYNFGTTVPVTLNANPFTTAVAGQVLTGTVTFTWGNPAATTVVTISVTVVSAGSTITGISPSTLPTAVPGSVFQIILTGSGFVGGTDPTLKTKIGLASGLPATIAQDSNFAISVTDSSHMTLTITVPTNADASLNFAPGGTNGVIGGLVTLGVCNGYSQPSTPCTVATGTAAFTIGNGPVIQGVSSASSFQQVSPGTRQTVAPYDMISVFGTSFCAAGNSAYANTYNCGSNTLLSATLIPLTLAYPLALTNEPAILNGVANTQQRFVSVSFYTVGGEAGSPLATAPLLFATNGQINALVPYAVHSAAAVDIVVNFGSGAIGSATMLSSAPFTVTVAATDPGIFTIGSDGVGAAAALATGTYAVIGASNPAAARYSGSSGDTIQLYVTGLGAPTSTADNTTTGTGGGAVAPTDCIGAVTGTGNYMATLQAATAVSPSLTSIDGVVIQSSLLNTHRLVPCLAVNPVVKIGGVTATVTYAGFVPDTVAGLYQINVQIPDYHLVTFYPNWTPAGNGTGSIASMTQAVTLPIYIQSNSVWSQGGVMVSVVPRLLMTPTSITASGIPNAGSYAATVGVAVSGSLQVAATLGTSTYAYAVTAGVLPAGLSLSASTGAISGTPASGTGGTYALTITATDSAAAPLIGTFDLTINVAGALLMSHSPSGATIADGPYGTVAPTTVTTVTATGGTIPYTYAITSTLPAGFSVNSTTGAVTTTATALAGQYSGFNVRATDSSSTPLVGNDSFEIDVPLKLTVVTSATHQTAGSPSALYQATASGNSGTLIYTITPVAGGTGGGTLAIDANTGIVTAGTGTTGTLKFTVTATDSVTHATGATGFGTATTGTIIVTID